METVEEYIEVGQKRWVNQQKMRKEMRLTIRNMVKHGDLSIQHGDQIIIQQYLPIKNGDVTHEWILGLYNKIEVAITFGYNEEPIVD